MQEIAKITNKEQGIVKEIEFSKSHSLIRDVEDTAVTQVVGVSAARAKQLCGYNNLHEDDFDFFVAEVSRKLSGNWKGLHISEVKIIFDLWADQRYGEWIGFTVQNFVKCVEKYFVDPVRLNALKEKDKPAEKPELDYDPGERRYEALKAEYEEKGTCEDTGNIVYDWMIEQGMIEKGFGNAFYKEAQELLIRKNKAEMLGCVNPTLAKNIKKIIDGLEEQHPNGLILAKAKKLAVIQYFKTEL